MSDRPIDLASRRASRDSEGPWRCESCGGEWFLLESNHPDVPAAVTLAKDGRITGYQGQPICLDCGF